MSERTSVELDTHRTDNVQLQDLIPPHAGPFQPLQPRLHDPPHEIRHRRHVRLAQVPEIERPHEVPRRLAHPFHVQRTLFPHEEELVHPALGTEPRTEILRDLE